MDSFPRRDRIGTVRGIALPCRARFAAGGLLAAATATAAPVAAQSNFGFARPIGGWTAGGQAGTGPIGGPQLSLEGGGSLMLGTSNDDARGSFMLGARAGWASAQGLAVHLSYDDLGVRPASASPPLQLATAGLRYTAPFVLPMPFAEVDAGGALVAHEIAFGGAAGLGLSVPLARHVLIDVAGRDWLVPIAGAVRQTFTASLGLSITFASPSY